MNTPANQRLQELQSFIEQHPKIMVLTGAGLSAASGIPTYRNHQGVWQRTDPIKHQPFMSQHSVRQRYWARSMVGWKHVRQADPNDSHLWLSRFEKSQRLSLLLTQNVDGLHQRAGNKNVCDLHGRIDQVVCMDCGEISKRGDLQTRLEDKNPWLNSKVAEVAPDGDADLEDFDIHRVDVPECLNCGGVLKPHVVFFGDNVPKNRVHQAIKHLENSDALWVIGSSLMVYSGLRFVRHAHAIGKKICLLNLGKTRGDDLADLKIEMDCSSALQQLRI